MFVLERQKLSLQQQGLDGARTDDLAVITLVRMDSAEHEVKPGRMTRMGLKTMVRSWRRLERSGRLFCESLAPLVAGPELRVQRKQL